MYSNTLGSISARVIGIFPVLSLITGTNKTDSIESGGTSCINNAEKYIASNTENLSHHTSDVLLLIDQGHIHCQFVNGIAHSIGSNNNTITNIKI